MGAMEGRAGRVQHSFVYIAYHANRPVTRSELAMVVTSQNYRTNTFVAIAKITLYIRFCTLIRDFNYLIADKARILCSIFHRR